jgi:16S rRNA (guanine527-N7)-methyltransferase
MTERKQTPSEEFIDALVTNAASYHVSLGADQLEKLRAYYEQIEAWNARLHLVARTTPVEFARRHMLESLAAVPFMSDGTSVVDVGSGAGLPVIPCMIMLPDLRAVLVESSKKKAVFLREALSNLGMQQRASVHARRFEDMSAPRVDFLMCRAVERFTETLSTLIDWAECAKTLLLFGGPTLEQRIKELELAYHSYLMPDSNQRYLFVVDKQV